MRPFRRFIVLGAAVVVVAIATGAPAAPAQAPPTRSPGSPDASQQADTEPRPERLVEVRVHGNYATPDQEVIQLAGLAIGGALPDQAVADVEARLRASGRFDTVVVRKRYRTFTSLDEVALIIIVRERPSASPDAPVAGPIKRTLGRMMWLPVLNYTDGYGFTYGARVSFVDVLGEGGRVSVPLTWGGTRHVAAELEKNVRRRALDRVFGGVSLSQRENPHYEVDDRRLEVSAGAGTGLAPHLRFGARGGWTDVEFGGVGDQFASYGADLVLDTRANPAFPRNALFVRGAWEASAITGGATVNRYTADARGYVGVVGSSVIAARALFQVADQPTPPYLQVLVGGAESLRGFPAGAFAGDNRFVSSLEWRLPLTSPLRVGQAGIDVFVDASTAYDHGESLREADMHYGVGGGAFLLFPIVQVNVDVARGSDGDWRVHFMGGFRF